MPATSAPNGFRPVFPQTGNRQNAVEIGIRGSYDGINNAYTTVIPKFAPVVMTANGVLNIGATTGALFGIFSGCSYTDTNGRRLDSPYWPGQTGNTDIVAYVWRADMNLEYEVWANGAIPVTGVGDEANCVNPTLYVAAPYGLSTSGLSSSLAGAGSTAQFQITGYSRDPSNLPGDTYPIMRVKFNQSSVGPASVVAY